jgi:hypothetical protein
MLNRFAIPILVTIASWLAGLLLAMQQGAAVSWSAVAITACAGLVIGPVTGTAVIAALPDILDSEKWGPSDLFLPALTSSAAFSFLVAQAIHAGLVA